MGGDAATGCAGEEVCDYTLKRSIMKDTVKGITGS